MTQIVNPDEEQIELTGDLPFVTTQSPPAGDGAETTPAWDFEVPEGYVVTVQQGTPVAPELYDSTGTRLVDDSEVLIKKADRRSNPVGGSTAFRERLGGFDYTEMRSEPDKFRLTNRAVVANEHEHIHVYVLVPSGENTLDHANSRLVIGDRTTSQAPAVRLRKKDSLPADVQKAVEQNTRQG